MGDTGLEPASGPWVRSDSLVLLRFGALRSAQGRSNCYQNCYQGSCQVAAVGNDRSHASCSSQAGVLLATRVRASFPRQAGAGDTWSGKRVPTGKHGRFCARCACVAMRSSGSGSRLRIERSSNRPPGPVLAQRRSVAKTMASRVTRLTTLPSDQALVSRRSWRMAPSSRYRVRWTGFRASHGLSM